MKRLPAGPTAASRRLTAYGALTVTRVLSDDMRAARRTIAKAMKATDMSKPRKYKIKPQLSHPCSRCGGIGICGDPGHCPHGYGNPKIDKSVLRKLPKLRRKCDNCGLTLYGLLPKIKSAPRKLPKDRAQEQLAELDEIGASIAARRGWSHIGPDEYALGLGVYEVREGRDGKWGIYTRKYNVRLATFASSSFALRAALKKLFEDANRVAQG
jgi:hypothetical protein